MLAQTLAPQVPFDYSLLYPFLLGIAVFVVVPVVWMLLTHQRKMAALLNPALRQDGQTSRLEAEVASLREQVTDQALEIDGLKRAIESESSVTL